MENCPASRKTLCRMISRHGTTRQLGTNPLTCVMPSLSFFSAPAPPKTMTKEWQEASTEMAKEQKINPITGKSSPARDRMSDTARSSSTVPCHLDRYQRRWLRRQGIRFGLVDEGVDCSRVMTLCEREVERDETQRVRRDMKWKSPS